MNKERAGINEAIKMAMAIVGVGVVAGATLVIGMNQIMKKIFVNDSWPEVDWTKDDWAQEELE